MGFFKKYLHEGLEKGDLKRLVQSELHVDEYKSKLGDDADMCVLSFKVGGKEPATDLVNFCEKGYDWVVDADVSSGEMDDGDYLVFVEMERKPELVDHIMTLMTDVMNLTEQELDEWQVRYFKSEDLHPIDPKTLAKLIPLGPEIYRERYVPAETKTDETEPTDAEQDDIQESLDRMRAAAGVTVTTKAPKNEYTQILRSRAGIL
jgi:hypothetical protein